MSRIGQRLRGVCAAIFLGAAFFSAPAKAQNAQAEIFQLVNAGDFDGARAALAKLPHSQVDELFLEAQILLKQGRPDDAVTIYRALLAALPDLIPVRQLLANALLQQGNYEAARFHFRTLLETDPQKAMHQRYANALRLIQQKIPSGASASFALIPSSNLNRGTENERFNSSNLIITDSGRRKSGIGGQFTINGFLRYPQEEGSLVTLSASAVATVYSSPEYNSITPTISASYQSTSEIGIWSIEAFLRKSFRRDIPTSSTSSSNFTSTSYGLGFSSRRKLEGPNIFVTSMSLQQVDYDTQPAQTGPIGQASFGLQRQINPTTSLVGGLKLGRGLPESQHLRYRSSAIYLGISKNWTGGWSSYVQTEAGSRWYDTDFPGTTFSRDDGYVSLTGSVLNSTLSWRGFSPRLTCLVQNNRSNITFYDYTATECNVILTRDF